MQARRPAKWLRRTKLSAIVDILTEKDLHLYVDGFLDRWGQEAVEACLTDDPELQERCNAYLLQIAEMHRWLTPTLHEPVPERLTAVLRRRRRDCHVHAVTAGIETATL